MNDKVRRLPINTIGNDYIVCFSNIFERGNRVNKFVFGQLVRVLKPHWKDENEIGVITASENGYNNVKFKGGWYSNAVPDKCIVPVSSWIPCGLSSLPNITVQTDSGAAMSKAIFFETSDGDIYHGQYCEDDTDDYPKYFIADLYDEVILIGDVKRWMYVPS